jgi:hypothetical protein
MDLVAINYRLEGLAEKICKTQCSQKGQRLGLDLQKIGVGAELEKFNFYRGVSTDLARHKKERGPIEFPIL